LVQDRAALDAVVEIGAEVFDNPVPADREAYLAEVLDDLAGARSAWVVGWLDGEPVGRARVGFEWQVAPLGRAAALPRARAGGASAGRAGAPGWWARGSGPRSWGRRGCRVPGAGACTPLCSLRVWTSPRRHAATPRSARPGGPSRCPSCCVRASSRSVTSGP